MKKLYLSIAFLLTFTFQVPAQLQGLDVVKVPEAQQPYSGEYIYIPDVDGYKALIRGKKRCVSKFGRSENI